MAIDSAGKRKSCIGIALGFLRTGVIPAGTNLSAADRLHTDGLYNGIAAAAPGGSPIGRVFGSNVFNSPVLRVN